ncbi:hypothetical protein P5673_027439, partial [Acropora cervicornis]
MFLTCVDEFVPKVVIKDANRPPWIDKEVLLLIRKKNRIRRKAKLKDSVNLWERFRELRRQVKKIVEFKKRSHLFKLSCSLGENPHKFWSYYKTITKTTRIPRVIKHEWVQATRPIDQANLFNMFFHSVFAPPDPSSAAIYLPRLNYSIKCVLSEVCVTHSIILKQLQSLDVNKASLGLPSKLLQACANEISPSLCRLFNLSLEPGTFPEKWKDANLVPLHKCESIDNRDFYLGGIKLDRVDVEKDLGILVSHNLSWNNHVNAISSKATKMLNCFKNICKLNILDYVSFRSCTKPLRNVDHLTLDVPFSRTDVFKNSFFVRICHLWN